MKIGNLFILFIIIFIFGYGIMVNSDSFEDIWLLNYNCPDITKELSFTENVFDSSDQIAELFIDESDLGGWSVGYFEYEAPLGLFDFEDKGIHSKIEIRCYSGSEEGQNINNYYCSSWETSKAYYFLEDNIDSFGNIKSTNRVGFEIEYNKNGELIDINCTEDPEIKLKEALNNAVAEFSEVMFN